MSLAIRKERRPRKRRRVKTKTKTADVVVKAQQQAMHRPEEESRRAAEMQAAKEDKRTQQEEASRCAAVKEKEGVDAAEERQVAIDETVEALFGVVNRMKRKGGVDAAEERQAAIEKLQALEEKRQAQDGGAPLKECWQLKDFRLITPRYMDQDRQRQMNVPGQTVLSENCSECRGGLL